MESDIFTFQDVLDFFLENNGVVSNTEVVHRFRSYLTNPLTKEESRRLFKEYVNTLAVSKQDDGEKMLYLKSKYKLASPSRSSVSLSSMNSVGLPLSPVSMEFSPKVGSPKQPPPYRPPPPPPSSGTPTAPPRRKSTDRRSFEESIPKRSVVEEEMTTPKRGFGDGSEEEKQGISVKERTQKFNRMASVEDELSPKVTKSAEKPKFPKGADEEDGAVEEPPVDAKKCVEWFVTASKGDFQKLLKMAKDEPRLVHKKDPFTAYTVLHWGAKHGNENIIKTFAGSYKVDVNGRTNGGYTPLHISAHFGHKEVFKLLIEVYKANTKIRDYAGRTPEYYLMVKEQREGVVTLRKKSRKKQSDKDLGFLRIGSLNVRVKKTTEAFSNFLGVGSGAINPLDPMQEKLHKSWGSADNLKEVMGPPKAVLKKKTRRPETVSGPILNGATIPRRSLSNDSDSDTAAGFDSNWKN